MTEQVSLTFDELRRIVMALYNQGSFLQKRHLPFSFGNVGNEYQALASRIDALVVDLEKHHKLTILKDEDLAKQEDWRGGQFDIIREWQKFSQQLGEILGSQGTTDDYLQSVRLLKKIAGEKARPIEELDLSARARNELKKLGIDSIGQITDRTWQELAYKMDHRTLNAVVEALKKFGLTLKNYAKNPVRGRKVQRRKTRPNPAL